MYDRSDPGAARVIIVAGSDFEETSPKLFWPETLVYLLLGAELNQMLTLVVAIKAEMPCEQGLLLFAGVNDHLHEAGLLEHLKCDAPTPKNVWETIQTLFAAMNEVRENVNSRFGAKTKVAFTTGVRKNANGVAICIRYLNAHSGGERVAGVDGIPQSRAGTHELETSEVEIGSGMGGCISCLEGILRVGRHPHCVGRGPIT